MSVGAAEQKQEIYYPRLSAEAEDVCYTIRGFGLLIKNDLRSRGLLGCI